MTEIRRRATIGLQNDIGQERYELYKSSLSWIATAINDGYYLEAINILESLIADRLESYLSTLLEKDFSFKTLSPLIAGIKSNSTDELLRSLVIDDLDRWRKNRNTASHEMVKIEEGKNVQWQERVKINKEVAETGLVLFRKINGRIRKLRSQATQSNNLAYKN